MDVVPAGQRTACRNNDKRKQGDIRGGRQPAVITAFDDDEPPGEHEDIDEACDCPNCSLHDERRVGAQREKSERHAHHRGARCSSHDHGHYDGEKQNIAGKSELVHKYQPEGCNGLERDSLHRKAFARQMSARHSTDRGGRKLVCGSIHDQPMSCGVFERACGE